jgi:ADP-L-glycero-D-manno-heptose 6-epimerase
MSWMLNEGWDVHGWSWDPLNYPDVKPYDWVIHLDETVSSRDTDLDKILKQNLEFSQWLFNECQTNEVHFQYASNNAVYGVGPNFSEFGLCNPCSSYAWSKFLFDRWVFQQEHKMYVQGFRYFNVYGKYMNLNESSTNLIHQWRTQARKQSIINVYANAEDIHWDWIWVGDVCKLHIDFIKQVNGSGLWNVGSGLTHSILDIAEEVAEQEGVQLDLSLPVYKEQEKLRFKICADLKHLKATIGKRKWLNIYEWLENEK